MKTGIYHSLIGLFVGLIVLIGATAAFGESSPEGEFTGAGFVVEGNFDPESLMMLFQPVNCELDPTLCPKPGCPPWQPDCPVPWPCSPEEPNCPWDPPFCNPSDPDCPIPPIMWEKPEVPGWKAFVFICKDPEAPCRAVPLEDLMESPEDL